VLYTHKEWNLAICNHMDGSKEYNAKRNKSVKDKYIWSHSYAEHKKTNEQRGEKRKRDEPTNRLLTIENKLKVAGREVGGMMGIKEVTCDEHWVLY